MSNVAIYTPEEFKDAIKKAIEDKPDDEELIHYGMDMVMCALLNSLGYNEGVDMFLEQKRWYA